MLICLSSALASSITYCAENNQQQNNQIPVQQIIGPQAGVVANNQQPVVPNHFVDPRISRIARDYAADFFGDDFHPDDPLVTNKIQL